MKNNFIILASLMFACFVMASCNKENDDKVKLESVALYPAAFEVKLGKNIRAELNFTPAIYMPQVSPKWTSSDPSVATVDDTGLIRALKLGTTTITMQLEDQSSSSKITVIEEAPVIPEPEPSPTINLRISPKIIMLSEDLIGSKIQLSLSVHPTDTDISTLQWISSNPAVVTVDNDGMITVIGKGLSFVWVKLNDITSSHCSVYITN